MQTPLRTKATRIKDRQVARRRRQAATGDRWYVCILTVARPRLAAATGDLSIFNLCCLSLQQVLGHCVFVRLRSWALHGLN